MKHERNNPDKIYWGIILTGAGYFIGHVAVALIKHYLL